MSTRERYLMACGHTDNATQRTVFGTVPACAICHVTDVLASSADSSCPNLEGRTAKCDHCGRPADSNLQLPWFRYFPDREYDTYYCGCRGWD